MDPFCYKVLLVDDLLSAKDKAEVLSAFGVTFVHVSGVQSCLERVFGVSDIKYVEYWAVEHDFDIVLLDYYLEPDMKAYPNGGIALYPLFVHGFTKKKLGQCVVNVYSARFRKDYEEYSYLFELTEQIRLRTKYSYSLAGFGDFALWPSIAQRAKSILEVCPSAVIHELYEIWTSSSSDEEALSTSLPLMSASIGRDVCMRSLRPDYGCEAFFRKGEMPAIDTQRIDLGGWLNDLLVNSNYAREAHYVYTFGSGEGQSTASKPDIYSWCHNSGGDESANDPRAGRDWEDGVLHLDKERRLHRDHVSAIKGVRCSPYPTRCSDAHRAFRLSLKDTASQHFPPYDKGYFLREITGQPFTFLVDHAVEGYVYVPILTLKRHLTDLNQQLENSSHTYTVKLCDKGRHVAFALTSSSQITREDAEHIGSRAKWQVKTSIAAWGELVICTESGERFSVVGRTLFTMPERFTQEAFPLPSNSISLLYPVEAN